MKIAVIDAHGGGIGKSIIEAIRKKGHRELEIIALGTNVLATSAMVKAGANKGVTGENAIMFNSSKVDVIMGGTGIIAANSMSGEMSPGAANSVSSSDAKKIIVPISKCGIKVAGTKGKQLSQLIDDAVECLEELIIGTKTI